jgi:hypothetical protein
MEEAFTKEQIEKLKEWDFVLRNLSDYVRIGNTNGIKFEIRTNEQSGHHKPHLHVSTSSADLSIAIDDGKILANSGKISPAQLKQAKEWIEDNRGLIISNWNLFSNGIKIEAT